MSDYEQVHAPAQQVPLPQKENGGKEGSASSGGLSFLDALGNQGLLALWGAQELTRLIGGGQKEDGGAVVANPDPESEHVKGAAYTAVKGRPFLQGAGDADAAAANDVAQGQLGDCYFVAALAAIAHTRPDVIKKKITDHGDGTYTVHFYEGGDVRVDGQFPTKGGAVQFAGEGDKDAKEGSELWVMLIEKAWAAQKGGYEKVRGSKVRMSSDDAMEAVTGASSRSHRPGSMSEDEILAVLAEAKKNAWPATLGVKNLSNPDEIKACRDAGLVPNHAFAVLDVDLGTKTVTAYNPWGAEYRVPPLKADVIKTYVDNIDVNRIPR